MLKTVDKTCLARYNQMVKFKKLPKVGQVDIGK